MDANTFSQVLDLIQMLVIFIGMVFIHRSIPAAQMESLIVRLEANARQTSTTVDDAAVGVARLLSMLITGQVATTDGQPSPQPQPVPMTVTGTVTASPASTPIHTADTVLELDSVG